MQDDVNKAKKGRKKEKRKSKSLLEAAENNAMTVICIKAKIDTTLKNGKCRWCGNGDETVNHIISGYKKLTSKEYKTTLVWVRNVILWELCKRLKVNHTTKWYIQKSESVLENETHKILHEF